MSLFETLVIVILGVYTLGSLYFAISGRILNHKMKKEREQERKEDIERADKSLQWEEQLKALTLRMGQLATENERIAGEYRKVIEENKKWQAAYVDLDKKYKALVMGNGDEAIEVAVPEENNGTAESHSGGHMKVSDKMDMEKQFGEEQ